MAAIPRQLVLLVHVSAQFVPAHPCAQEAQDGGPREPLLLLRCLGYTGYTQLLVEL